MIKILLKCFNLTTKQIITTQIELTSSLVAKHSNVDGRRGRINVNANRSRSSEVKMIRLTPIL